MITRNTRDRLLSSILLLALVGCCTLAKPDPVVQFHRKHPTETKRYTYIYPVSLDGYYMLLGYFYTDASQVAESVKRKFGQDPGVVEFTDKILKYQADKRKGIVELFRRLESEASNGGVICQYQWSDGKNRETGLLVLRSGEVVERVPWITDYLSEQSGAEDSSK